MRVCSVYAYVYETVKFVYATTRVDSTMTSEISLFICPPPDSWVSKLARYFQARAFLEHYIRTRFVRQTKNSGHTTLRQVFVCKFFNKISRYNIPSRVLKSDSYQKPFLILFIPSQWPPAIWFRSFFSRYALCHLETWFVKSYNFYRRRLYVIVQCMDSEWFLFVYVKILLDNIYSWLSIYHIL